jgi:hypothetical protein
MPAQTMELPMGAPGAPEVVEFAPEISVAAGHTAFETTVSQPNQYPQGLGKMTVLEVLAEESTFTGPSCSNQSTPQAGDADDQ